MTTGLRSIPAVLQIAVIASFLMSGCNEIKPGATNAACSTTGTAQIEIFDGSMERVCGCTEPANVTFGTSGLQCTVTRGTTLVFLFPSIQTTHQVAIPYFGTSGWAGQVRTSAGGLNQSDQVQLNSSGTFQFSDNYAGLSGTIIVQ